MQANIAISTYMKAENFFINIVKILLENPAFETFFTIEWPWNTERRQHRYQLQSA